MLTMIDYDAKRTLDVESLRGLCIQQHYFTKGTNEEYEYMFQCMRESQEEDGYLSDIQICWIVNQIYQHSDIEKIQKAYGCSDRDVMESILHNVLQATYTTVKEITLVEMGK